MCLCCWNIWSSGELDFMWLMHRKERAVRSPVIMSDMRVLTGRAEQFINCCCVPLSPAGFLDTQPELGVSDLNHQVQHVPPHLTAC